MLEAEIYKVAGEKPPFLTGTKSCLERLGRVVIKHGLKITGSYCGGYLGRSSCFIVSLAIPASKLAIIEQELQCTLTDHMDVQVGFDVVRSAKWKDVDGKIYLSPY